MDLLNPKEITLSVRGKDKTFVLSEIPAIPSREIAALYLPSALPKIGEYKTNEAMMYKMMAFVSVKMDQGPDQLLRNADLINNHTDFQTLAKLEWGMIEHNYGFFLRGTGSTFSEGIIRKAKPLILKMWMDLQAASSQKAAPVSTNSEQSTASGTPS